MTTTVQSNEAKLSALLRELLWEATKFSLRMLLLLKHISICRHVFFSHFQGKSFYFIIKLPSLTILFSFRTKNQDIWLLPKIKFSLKIWWFYSLKIFLRLLHPLKKTFKRWTPRMFWTEKGQSNEEHVLPGDHIGIDKLGWKYVSSYVSIFKKTFCCV